MGCEVTSMRKWSPENTCSKGSIWPHIAVLRAFYTFGHSEAARIREHFNNVFGNDSAAMNSKHNTQGKCALLGRARHNGMSLIELMISIVIAAILVSIAIPAYEGSIKNSRRSEAHTSLLAMQLQQEAFRQSHNEYAATQDLKLPVSRYYNFEVSDAGAVSYTLKAVAKGTQLNDLLCLNITLDHTFDRQPIECWQ